MEPFFIAISFVLIIIPVIFIVAIIYSRVLNIIASKIQPILDENQDVIQKATQSKKIHLLIKVLKWLLYLLLLLFSVVGGIQLLGRLLFDIEIIPFLDSMKSKELISFAGTGSFVLIWILIDKYRKTPKNNV